MIELKKVRGISEEINEYTSGRRSKHGIPETLSSKHSARLLNQEKDGCIIYAWDDVSDASEGAVVTHFGLYNPVLKKHQIVYVYNQRVYVVSASINQERTMMAFTTMSHDGSSLDRRTEKYSAFLAEIKAESPRVFSLNLERQRFIKVQFLYENKRTDGRALMKKEETYMLVMLHKESIGLYKIPLARTANGMVMRGQPKMEQVGKRFVWCQWDCMNQQLCYIHVINHRKDAPKEYMFSCVHFYNAAVHDNVLDVPLNFPFYSKSSSKYADIPLHNGIPDTSINACVLTLSNGTFCICYQNYVSSSERRSESVPLPRTSPLQRTSIPVIVPSTSENEIKYYICMVHHAKTVVGYAKSIPDSVVKKAVVSFSLLGDMVMIMLPGHFLHLLNLSIEFEPCNHILLHNRTYLHDGAHMLDDAESHDKSHDQSTDQSGASIDGASSESMTSLPVLGALAEPMVFHYNCPLVNMGKDASDNVVIERNTGCEYKVKVNKLSLVKIFIQCHDQMLRSAILHYVILKQKGFTLTKQLFSALCNDIASTEVPNLMTEFLTAMTYVNMRRQIDREVLHLIPFTHASNFAGTFDKAQDGSLLGKVTYSEIQSINIHTKTAKERLQKKGSIGDDWLDMLRRHLRMMQRHKSYRFKFEVVKNAYKQIQKEDEKQLQTKEEENFLTKIRMNRSKSRLETDGASHFSNKSESVLGMAPAFLQASSVTELSETLMALTRSVLAKHLMTYLAEDGKVKANSVAKEYVSCQFQQSRLLCHLLWTLRGLHLHDQTDMLPSLSERGDESECALLQLYERYVLITSKLLFPVPLGFNAYFTCLAFRCLDKRMFMQYVDHGVVQLTGDFMGQLIKELPDDEEGHDTKQNIISKLALTAAEECYKVWGHNTCNTYMAHKHVAKILTESAARSSLESSDTSSYATQSLERSNSTLESITFQPLAAFLRHLAKNDTRRTAQDRGSPLDYLALEEVALLHTNHETDYDMGTVNF